MKKQRIGTALVALGAGGLLVSLGLLLHHPNGLEPSVGITSSHAPSAAKPTVQTVAEYEVAPDLPKYIEVPSIGLKKSRIVRVGLKNGQISNPDNIYDAGWFSGSSRPGQSGAMFIFGHVSSWQAHGIFYNLKNLRIGDRITISRGDGGTFNYKVEKIKTYDANNVNMNEVLSPVVAGKNGLNLMTCSGTVIKGTSDFTNRLVIFTSQIVVPE